jgi:hypothetical protein
VRRFDALRAPKNRDLKKHPKNALKKSTFRGDCHKSFCARGVERAHEALSAGTTTFADSRKALLQIISHFLMRGVCQPRAATM